MHDFKSRLLRYAATPPGTLWRKAVRRIKSASAQRVHRARDQYCSSYAPDTVSGQLFLHLQTFPLQEAAARPEILQMLTEHYLAHRFDLLGSGWVPVYHGAECRGVEEHRYEPVAQAGLPLPDRINPANRRESSRLQGLLEGDYRPIDWQLDFKSGFRWREDCWYKDIAISTGCPGADIKVPWELARCQHLPQLALAYGLARAGTPGFRDALEYQREFRNQIIDFMAGNPPRFGVNWACPMDIGIRIANWLMAYDLFVAAGAEFDNAFVAALSRSVHEHGLHIAGNLEWNEAFRSNHYLADLAGLLFAGAYLPSGTTSDDWIRTAAVELLIEIPAQFNGDGSNFEASTCYHRLSAEMAVYSVALLSSILRRRLPLPWQVSATRPGGVPTHWEDDGQIFSRALTGILERAAEFSMHATKEDGCVVQIGDNDSGRFFKLQPAGAVMTVEQARRQQENLSGYAVLRDNEDYWLEDSLDHRHLAGAIGALFARQDLSDFAGPFGLDAAVIRILAGNRRFQGYRDDSQPMKASTVRKGADHEFVAVETRLQALPSTGRQSYRFPLPSAVSRDAIENFGYPDFGLFIFKANGFYLAIRCGPQGQAGNGGHDHHDQLSVELVISGHAHALDPGTYLYTALPERRNEYRAAAAHFSPRIAGMEPGSLAQLFSLPDLARAECLYFGRMGFIGRHHGYGTPVYRVIAFADHHVEIRDYAEGRTLEACSFADAGTNRSHHQGTPFSAGYGMRSRSTVGN
ncbi:MAG: heparinase II/III family protein [Burkholderiales bacterium]|nr:heparinase II/III family protein [Burkholderiales bacterium]